MTATYGDYQDQPGILYNQSLFAESAVQKQRLGTIRPTDDGRRFVYCQATAAEIAAGIIVSKAVAVQACTVAAADAVAAGARKITLTLTGTPTLNLYRDGWAIITAGTGLGGMYKIKGNSVDDVPADSRCTFYLYDALEVALTTAGQTFDVIVCPYDGVLINPANSNYDGTGTGLETPLGVTTRTITASYYFWAQTRGLAALMMDIDSAAGAEDNEKTVICGTTQGRGGIIHDTAIPGFFKVGELVITVDATDAEAALVNLCIS